MENTIDILFRIVVYSISIYLILIKQSRQINLVGFVILISHLYKDITNLEKWPMWTEFVAIFLGMLLIHGGICISNYFVVLLGLIIIIGHSRQLLFNDDRYYY